MDYNIKCVHTNLEGYEVDETNSDKYYRSLEISSELFKIVVGFNYGNYSRTIPYLIYCIETGRHYQVIVDSDTSLLTELTMLEITVSNGHSSFSTIALPLEIYKNIIIR